MIDLKESLLIYRAFSLEKVMWKSTIPARERRSKMDSDWRHGAFLGQRALSGEYVVGTPDGICRPAPSTEGPKKRDGKKCWIQWLGCPGSSVRLMMGMRKFPWTKLHQGHRLPKRFHRSRRSSPKSRLQRSATSMSFLETWTLQQEALDSLQVAWDAVRSSMGKDR